MATLLNNSCAYKRPSGTCAKSPTLLGCKSGEIHGIEGVLEALHPPARLALSSPPRPCVPSFMGSASPSQLMAKAPGWAWGRCSFLGCIYVLSWFCVPTNARSSVLSHKTHQEIPSVRGGKDKPRFWSHSNSSLRFLLKHRDGFTSGKDLLGCIYFFPPLKKEKCNKREICRTGKWGNAKFL